MDFHAHAHAGEIRIAKDCLSLNPEERTQGPQ